MDIKATIARRAGMIAFISAVSTMMAMADVAADLTNFSLIATNFVSLVTTIMAMFLSPPLLYFTFLAIFVAIVGIVRSLIKR